MASLPPGMAIPLTLSALAFLLIVPVLRSELFEPEVPVQAGLSASNKLAISNSHPRRASLRLVRRQFDVAGAGNSSAFQSFSSAFAASDAQTGAYELHPQLAMAIQATARRGQQVKNLIDANAFGGSQKYTGTAGRSVTKSDPTAGQYTISLGLGSPSQQLDLILDTASRWVWVFDSGDQGCYHHSASSSYAEVGCLDSGCDTVSGSCQDGQCRYDHQLSDGSHSTGRVVSDTATITSSDGGNLVVNSLLFGVSDSSSGFQGSGGVLGLGRSESSFTNQLAANLDLSSSFATCLAAWDAPSDSGLIFFGSWNSQNRLSYTPLVSSYVNIDFYYVKLVCIQVAGATLDVPEGTYEIDPTTGYKGFFIDSGVTFTQLVPDAYNSVLNEMKSMIPYPGAQVNGLELCYDTSSAGDDPGFPSLTFVFDGGAQMDFPKENVFVKAVSGNDHIWCLGIEKMDNFNILGNVQQQNFLIEYNMENHEVGWRGPLQCSDNDY